jgi:23S rRNA pseudouridine1911/1915/1917 synthase
MHKNETILEVRENIVLMQFLLQNLKGKSRDNIKSLLRYKQVCIDGKPVSQYNYALQPGQQVVVKQERSGEGTLNRWFHIVFEDQHIIVIDKQAGLLSISAGSEHMTAYSLLSAYLKQQDPANKIFIVHRLDRDTSGLMIFAKSEEVQSVLQKGWQTDILERTYVALVEGIVEKQEDTIKSYLNESKAYVVHSSQDPAKGELAITHYKTMKRGKDFSLLEVNLETGKKNQIRVHMQDIGHSVAGDKKYGASGNPIDRLGLHASVLAFLHPVTGESLRFTSNIPAKFLRVF